MDRRLKSRTSRTGGVLIDFSDVDTQQRRRKIPSGDYAFRITEIEDGEGEKGPYWTVISEVTSGKYEGFKDWSRYSFSQKALWKLAQLLTACGIEVSKKKMNLRKKDLIGLEFGASVEEEEYEGKVRSRIADVFPMSELEESDEDEEETENANEADDDEDEEEVDDEDEEEVDEDEDEDEDEEETPKKTKKVRR